MENFQYSVQLSERDWAEFAAAADECGLQQISLASGDELPCSDIEQGDSSGSSPPGGRAWPCSRREDELVTQRLVSRSGCEPDQQTPSTSTQPGGDPAPPEPSTAAMQRLLQGPALRRPASGKPSPGIAPQESPSSPRTPQESPSSPGALPRSPGRKKRHAVARVGGHPGALVSCSEAQPEEGLLAEGARQGEQGPDGQSGHEWEARPCPPEPVGQPSTDPLRTSPRTRLARRAKSHKALSTPTSDPQQLNKAPSAPALDLQQLDTTPSIPALDPQQLNTALSIPTLNPRELNTAPLTPTLDPELLGTVSCIPASDPPQLGTALSAPTSDPQQLDMAPSRPSSKPQPPMALSIPTSSPQQQDMALSTPTSNSQQLDTALSTTSSKPQPEDLPLSTPACKLQPDRTLSTLSSKPPPDTALSIPASKVPPDTPLSTPSSEPQPDTALSKSASKPQVNVALYTPSSKPPPDMALSTPTSNSQQLSMTLSTPVSKAQVNTAQSTPSSKPQPDMALSTFSSKPQLEDLTLSTPICKLQPDTTLSPLSFKSQVNMALSTSPSEPRLNAGQPIPSPMVKAGAGTPAPASKASPPTALSSLAAQAPSNGGVFTPAPRSQTTPDVGVSCSESPGSHGEKPREEPPAGGPGPHNGDPQLAGKAARRKKVRFSMDESDPKSLEAMTLGPPSPVRPLALRTAAWDAGGPGAWDAVAVGSRPPQPRILKHLPPPTSSALGGPAPRSNFAVTLPEAYEFFFCDTIEEEDEDVEDSQASTEVQWPDVCEFFFRDTRAQRPRSCSVPAPDPPAPPPREPLAFPEAYEHFLGEDGPGGILGPAALLRLQALEAPTSGPLCTSPMAPSDALPRQLELALRGAGQPQAPLMSFNLSQRDMCLVFVAFATWAVRTSDLQTPDAWKTVLLANIGTVSAIRYFRRQVRRGYRSPSQSPSPSRSPSPSS
ncbi:PGC-1 and ERR-induced regulator in muscle protein 1 [Erinaceus europaeus]|uniref:PGC-1 and ERR-induced regulator in muscle protein 1 n=1 Tax=Erinaceus europaeus TaxID=9365 RepID=A0A1S2ZWS8_ERIEU|nr:PGC-1 and ERR-induced regulator in muscle protein 1 [Erinaceus europaeus]XP_060055800.1 PGC-1 and ERR-induced regulator in muscle protein 1 [Erinaceus europaeus]XP_060055802.1 PGC-1 and ERR-induced regulator in muscle protein 1 [Erinaceus europaeus]XP_060055803.1 PGC-1 and ERR-induced regulator in muscle protein 1 [Erinaceus europaeus]XP_060055804.1 PGC-1 and ERR-induced regulator in muscle protein 1 [Erinaceus europaeus]